VRLGLTYGVAIFDIDHFKAYNDYYGHVAGDGNLRRVAACIDLVVRAGECAYRYGGEEFLVLVPDCSSPDAAVVMAERIRGGVVDAAIPHRARPSSPPFVTLSGGVACWTPGSALTGREVIQEADRALFEAKSAGRNRVFAGPSVRGGVETGAGVGR
jgi:diguanylate cyclase (GGDEF)-like protein